MISIEIEEYKKLYFFGGSFKEPITDNDDDVNSIAIMCKIRFALKSLEIYDECTRIKNSSFNKIVL